MLLSIAKSTRSISSLRQARKLAAMWRTYFLWQPKIFIKLKKRMMRLQQMKNPKIAVLHPPRQPKNLARQSLTNYQINQSQQKRREVAAEVIFSIQNLNTNSVGFWGFG